MITRPDLDLHGPQPVGRSIRLMRFLVDVIDVPRRMDACMETFMPEGRRHAYDFAVAESGRERVRRFLRVWYRFGGRYATLLAKLAGGSLSHRDKPDMRVTPGRVYCGCSRSVLPTPVGVNRRWGRSGSRRCCAPHARGGEP